MPATRRRILLIQLPIPQPGLEPAEGNVPLAAGYLKLLARLRGLDDDFDIEILPASLANRLSDQGLAAEIIARDAWLVGWTCYLWNVQRSLDVARLVKRRRPEVRMLVGGPEITGDNDWVLERPEVDFAAIGEGEQTFVELLGELRQHETPSKPIAGLYVSPALAETVCGRWADRPAAKGLLPAFRTPLASLDEVSSPYTHGILDAADEEMLLLETLRGCVFKCKFCYYPKSYDDLYFASRERIVRNLAHARERGAREVVLLDPTLNQRRDFSEFLKLLAECNPDQQFTYFGELRAEGITAPIARLLREANFSQVEIGLQSIDPLAQELMDRNNNLKAFQRGVSALRDEGLQVKIDLIIGLPGDTRESIRRSLAWLHESGLYDEVQVFNLAVLPGTAFRQEAAMLGLEFQPRPPYYVLKTPTLDLADLCTLMQEAEELFDTEFDPLPPPQLEPVRLSAEHADRRLVDFWQIDLDEADGVPQLPPAADRAQAFVLWMRAADFRQQGDTAVRLIEQLLDDNPHSTLQVVLQPRDAGSVTPALLHRLERACYRTTNYLDRFYSIVPGAGAIRGSKRLVVLLEGAQREQYRDDQLDTLADLATIVWQDEEPDVATSAETAAAKT